MLSGESVGGSGIELGGTALGVSQATGVIMTGDITLRAFNTSAPTLAAPMLQLPGQIATTGILALRPGGVSATGALTGKDSVVINVGDFTPAPDGELAINQLVLGAVVDASVSSVVIGSDTHTGLIKLTAPATLTGSFDLTLQNGGAGSAGINLLSALDTSGANLTLSSGGSVTQAAGITANGVLLHGTQAASNFSLNNAGNSVNTLSVRFEQTKGAGATDGDASFSSAINLAMGPLIGFGADSTTNLRQTIDASSSTVSGDLTVLGTAALSVLQPIIMTGESVTLDLNAGAGLSVADTLTANGDVATIGLNSATNADIGGTINMNGSLAFLNINATDVVNLTGTVNMGGAQGVASVNAGSDVNAAGIVTMSGASGQLNLTSGGGNINYSGTSTLTGFSSGVDFSASNTLTSTGDIAISGGDAALDMTAGNLMTLSGNTFITGNGSVFALAGNGMTVTGTGLLDMTGPNASLSLIVTGPGNLSFSGVANIGGTGANVLMNSAGDLSLAGTVALSSGPATVELLADNNIALSGSVTAAGTDTDLTFTAGNNLSATGSSTVSMSGANAVLRMNADSLMNAGGAITLSGANADMALQTTTGNLTVSGPVSMSGGTSLMRFISGQDAIFSGSVSTAGGATVQSVNAEGDIVLNAGTNFFGTGPLNLDFNADSDNLNGGAIVATGGASIATNGGALRMYGQSDAAAGYATGAGFTRQDGISLTNTTISTGSGTLTMRGRGTTPVTTGPAFPGNGVEMNQASLTTTSGAVSITGLGGQGGSGITLTSSTVATTAGAAMQRERWHGTD